MLCTAEFVSDEQLFAKKLKFPELSDQAKFVPPKKDDVAGLVRGRRRKGREKRLALTRCRMLKF